MGWGWVGVATDKTQGQQLGTFKDREWVSKLCVHSGTCIRNNDLCNGNNTPPSPPGGLCQETLHILPHTCAGILAVTYMQTGLSVVCYLLLQS